MAYYRDKPSTFEHAFGCLCFAGVMLIFVILAVRLVLGLVPPGGFWGWS